MSSSETDLSFAEVPVLHVDLDAFFASVEILDNPSLRGLPVVVGGSGERGVVASASYEARRFGVRSAMPSATAKAMCPDIIFLSGNFARYEEYSRRFHDIVADVTPWYEPIGLDEVFADLSGRARLPGSPREVAWALRTRIRDELGLDCGVGVARNKLFAKLASKDSKPKIRRDSLVPGEGVVIVSRAVEAQWLSELPVRALWGVGPATAHKLSNLGLNYVRDLAGIAPHELQRHFGQAMGETLALYAIGEDPRSVEANQVAKSVGRDETFAVSLRGTTEVHAALRRHAGVVARALRDKGVRARTITVVVRYDEWDGLSRSQTLPFGIDDDEAVTAVAIALSESFDFGRAMRLVGIHASGLDNAATQSVQLAFGLNDDTTDARLQAETTSREQQLAREPLRDAIDEIRARYGRHAVGSVGEIGDEGLEVRGQRDHDVFGPSGQ